MLSGRQVVTTMNDERVIAKGLEAVAYHMRKQGSKLSTVSTIGFVEKSPTVCVLWKLFRGTMKVGKVTLYMTQCYKEYFG